MRRDEFRRQLETVQYPVVFRVHGCEMAVNSRDDLMIPGAGDLICIYHGGAFDLVDCNPLSIIHREGGKRAAGDAARHRSPAPVYVFGGRSGRILLLGRSAERITASRR